MICAHTPSCKQPWIYFVSMYLMWSIYCLVLHIRFLSFHGTLTIAVWNFCLLNRTSGDTVRPFLYLAFSLEYGWQIAASWQMSQSWVKNYLKLHIVATLDSDPHPLPTQGYLLVGWLLYLAICCGKVCHPMMCGHWCLYLFNLIFIYLILASALLGFVPVSTWLSHKPMLKRGGAHARRDSVSSFLLNSLCE